MLHKMKLLERPFSDIKSGVKTVEFRLNDEKRRKIKIGDKIEFSKLPDMSEKIVVRVVDLYPDVTFRDLFSKLFDNGEEIERKCKGMYEIYSKEQEDEYGVLGIKIEIDDEK